MRFSNLWCASAVCTPSRFNYLTGAYGSRCSHPDFIAGVPKGGACSVEFNTWLDGQMPTMGSLFRAAGYRTGFAGKWHNSPDAEHLGCEPLDSNASPDDPGMNEALARRQRILSEEVRRVGGYEHVGGVLWGNPSEEPLKALQAHHLEWSLDHALHFLDGCSDEQPFLLHYASTCYHGPNMVDTVGKHDMLNTPEGRMAAPPSSAIPRSSWKKLCEQAGLPFDHESITFLWMDREMELLTRRLEELVLLDNTIVVFAGDHGNEPGKGTCYDSGSRIPLILAGPGVPVGQVFSHPAQNVDLLPTLAGLAGLHLPSGAAPDGIDLGKVWRGEAGPREHVYLENGFTRAVRTKDWKYIVRQMPEAVAGTFEAGEAAVLFDHYGHKWAFPALRIAASMYPGFFDPEQLYSLTEDAEEQRNLAANPACRAVLGTMQRLLLSEIRRLPHGFEILPETVPKTLPPGLIEHTRRVYSSDSIAWWPEALERYERHFRGRVFC